MKNSLSKEDNGLIDINDDLYNMLIKTVEKENLNSSVDFDYKE